MTTETNGQSQPSSAARLARACRELANECEAGTGPALGRGQMFHDFDGGRPCCTIGHTIARADMIWHARERLRELSDEQQDYEVDSPQWREVEREKAEVSRGLAYIEAYEGDEDR